MSTDSGTRKRIWAGLLTALVWVMLAGAARAQDAGGAELSARFAADLAALATSPTRVIGSAGYTAAAEYLRRELRGLPNVEVREHSFPVLMPVTKEAALVVEDRTIEVYPFWPAGVRPNATPAGGIRGKLVYAGRCELTELRPASLRGQIAVVEAAAGERWTQAGVFGAAAIVVLGDERATNADLRWHDVPNPIGVPRVYVPAAQAAAVRELSKTSAEATLRVSVNWEPRTAVNFYALVGKRSAADSSRALVLSVPYESSSLVPDLAPGAGQAVQAAAGLALVRDLANRPLDCPVLVAFTGGDSMQMKATRNMLMALAQPPAAWAGELEELARRGREIAVDRETAVAAAANPGAIDPRRDERLVDRVVKAVEADITSGRTRLFDLRTKADASAVDRETVARLEREQVTLSAVRHAMQKAPGELDGELAAQAKRYLDAVAARLERQGKAIDARAGELRARGELYRWLAGRTGLNPEPRANDYASRLIEAVIAVDLSGAGVRVGPMYYGSYQNSNAIADIQDYRDWLSKRAAADARLVRAAKANEAQPTEQARADLDSARAAADGAAWYRAVTGALDLSPLTDTSRSPQTWLATSLPLGSEMGQAWGVPAFSLITLDDARLFRDTPNDTLANVNVGAIVPQLVAVRELVRNAWGDPAFRGPVEKRPARTSVAGQVVGPAPDRPIPDLPREGFLATFYYLQNPAARIPSLATLPYAVGVRRGEVVSTDADGNYLFEGLPRLGPDPQMRKLAVQVYKLAPDTGAVVGATDLGENTGDLPLMVDLNTDPLPLRSVVFDFTEFSLFGLYDPRFLQTLTELFPLDARRSAPLQRCDFVPFNGTLAGFVDRGLPLQLLLRYGSVGNRLVMLNVADPAEAPRDAVRAAEGFDVAQFRHESGSPPVLPAPLQSAQDFWRLNDIRLRGYASAGVTSPQLDAMHQGAAEQLAGAHAAYKADDGRKAVSLASSAWAAEARVYDAAHEMANDVVRAAIFLLLLCVPFSFCMERLLVAATSIYRQIAWAAAIFALMTIALASFHPAFKISTSPLVIVLAFAIVLMSGVVTWVVYQKFDTELKRLRSGVGHGDGPGVARAGVLMSAVLLGIASMRRRRFRTALTSVTIILITFAVLCFTSSTRYLDTVRLPTGAAAEQAGVMLRQRGFRPMPPAASEALAAALVDMGFASPKVAEQWWNVNAGDPNEQVNVTAAGEAGTEPRVVPVAAVLGIAGAIDPRVESVLGADKLAALKEGKTDVVYLPRPVADQLKVAEGGRVTIGGIGLRVAGVFDPDAYDAKVIALSGEPLRPLSYRAGELDASGRPMTENATAEALNLGGGASAAEAQQTYEHLPAARMVILPATTARLLPNCSLRGLTVPLANDAEVKRVSDELSKRFSLAVFAADSGGVSLVSASNLQSVSGAGQVAVPLAIAGLIIFNTMMGSIAERRREIHVYTSLGLAPLHVGALFVAEALTYGLIGTVFGYVIGQGAGTLLSKLGLLGNVTLNYSGSSAMATMGLILLVVTASALVPARVASKIAAPSIDRTWRVPDPDGDQIIAHLPFTINKAAADGALAYLAEFFESNREGSIGKFSAGKVEPFTLDAHDGSQHRGLQTTVWLTPFDLGVRQHLLLLIHPGQYPDIYEVQVILQRLSGDDGSWRRMNRQFLTLLRQQFLQWRSLSPQRMADFVEVSRVFFSSAPHIAAEPDFAPVPAGQGAA